MSGYTIPWFKMGRHVSRHGNMGGPTALLLGGLIYSFVPVLKPYFHILAWTGFVYTIIVLFTINTDNLKQQPSLLKVSVFSSTVIRNNRILISIALIMFISYFDDFKNACMAVQK